MAIDPKFIITLGQGRDAKEYPLYAGILAEAHALGLQSLTTKILQIPGSDNEYTAIVEATALFGDGRLFCDMGDASPRNVNARIATALLRMASTRAKGRALRDAINCGQTMLEELPDLNSLDETPESAGDRASRAVQAAERERVADRVQQPAAANGQMVCSNPACGKALTKGQHEVSTRAYGQPLCPACQKLHAKLG
jgi:hypothetical protein